MSGVELPHRGGQGDRHVDGSAVGGQVIHPDGRDRGARKCTPGVVDVEEGHEQDGVGGGTCLGELTSRRAGDLHPHLGRSDERERFGQRLGDEQRELAGPGHVETQTGPSERPEAGQGGDRGGQPARRVRHRRRESGDLHRGRRDAVAARHEAGVGGRLDVPGEAPGARRHRVREGQRVAGGPHLRARQAVHRQVGGEPVRHRLLGRGEGVDTGRAVVPAGEPDHLHRRAGRRDLAGVRIGVVQLEEGVLGALQQQGRCTHPVEHRRGG